MPFWVLGLAAWLALAPTVLGAEKGRRRAPTLNIDGVVNAASFTPAPDNFVSPNAIIAIFGVELALRTRAVQQSDLVGRSLPLSLAGVEVRIGGVRAPLYFVSPNQINAQVPSAVIPGDWKLQVVRENLASNNDAIVRVRAVAPGLFPVVVHGDFRLVGRGDPHGSTPAKPGEMVVLFATGLGPTAPAVFAGELPNFRAPVVLPVRARLAERSLPASALLYVGQAPRLAGLYQINVLLPDDITAGDLEFFVEVDGVESQPGVTIAVEP